MIIDLTDNKIKKLQPPKDRRKTLYFDSKFPGFGVSVTNKGMITFFLRYTFRKTPKTKKIGRFGEFNTNSARDEALRMKSLLARGKDPSRKYEDEVLFEDFAKDFLQLKQGELRKSTFDSYKGALKNHILPEFKKFYLHEINKANVHRFLKRFANSQASGNRTLAILSSILNSAVENEYITKNPALGIKKFANNSIERYLTEKELKKLFLYLDKNNHKIQSKIIKILLYTGARKSEVLSLRWGELDLEKGIWHKKAAKTKQKKDSIIPLNQKALDILRDLEKRKGEVFEDHIEIGDYHIFFHIRTKSHVKDIKKFWQILKEKTKISDLRIHDLRHNFASMLISKSVSIEVISRLLGHSNIKTTQRYAHLSNKALGDATNLLNDVED